MTKFDAAAYVRWRTENGWAEDAAFSVAAFVTVAERELDRARDPERPAEERELALALATNLTLDLSERAARVFRELVEEAPTARRAEMRAAYEKAIGAAPAKEGFKLVKPRRN